VSDPGASPAFVCAACKRGIGDPLYHGPAGHAPHSVCFDCWTEEWACIEACMVNGGDWSLLDSALWLVCCGLTRRQAAIVLGLHRNKIRRWILHLRRNPRDLPDWLRARLEAHCGRV
jgi:hypothetical protein